MNHKPPLQIPAPDAVKNMRCLSCSACQEIAPFTIHEFEHDASAAQLATGWQLRMLVTQVISDEGPSQALRWDFYCPLHAGEWNPRPDGSWRVSAGRGDDDRKAGPA
jgi:hypothetical protein